MPTKTERILIHPAIVSGLLAYAKTRISYHDLVDDNLIELHALIMHGEVALGQIADEPPKFGQYLELLKQ